jgi:carbamate kinase
VAHVALDFETPAQRAITDIDVATVEGHRRDGRCPEGSMGPKIRAAIAFLSGGGRTAVITTPENAAAALSDEPGGGAGTRITATVPAVATQ